MPVVKIALSHDWLNGMRGGEKCLDALCELYPQAPIYTLFYEPSKINSHIAKHPIRTSFIQSWPKIYSHYRYYLPFFPRAIESFRPQNLDVVISTNHCVAKGIPKNKGAVHICYCFTPMRYAWGFFEEYFGQKNKWFKMGAKALLERLKKWDLETSSGVDHFVAISKHIQKRIKRCYGREAAVIYPPVDTEFFTVDGSGKKEDFYLIVSALVPYKRVDIAVQAFNRSGRKLVVIGDGPEKESLRRAAKPNIQFIGWQPNKILREHYRKARALIFPGEEDFGIVPVESQACGTPVIAYAQGGALETICANKTGLFFNEPTAPSLEQAIGRFETMNWSPETARQNALGFSRERFKNEMKNFIDSVTRHACAATT